MRASPQAYPLDLVRTRLSAQTKAQYYRGISHAVSTIVRDEGLRGLYRRAAAPSCMGQGSKRAAFAVGRRP